MAVTPSTRALITWTEYKALLGIASDSEQDRYQTIINQASARVEGYCHRALKSTTYSGATALILDGSGRDSIVLPHYPVTAVTHLYVDSERAYGSDAEVVASDYSLRVDEGMIILYDTIFPAEIDAVKVECAAGYASASNEWQDIQTACFELVRWMDSRYRGFIGKRTETNGDGMSTGYEIEIPLNVRSILEPYVGRSA